MSTYVIGDVHGCLDTLDRLLEAISFDPDDDRLWFVGDLVNGGPDSAEVVRRVRDFGDDAVCVLGNHDLHLLAVAAVDAPTRERDTFEDLLEAPDSDELLEWLRHRPLVHREGDTLMVHAGLYPSWTADRAVELAGETERLLRSDRYVDFLDRMYGNEPRGWSDDLEGVERHRVIVNGTTRMRCLDEAGRMDFDYKETLDGIPDGLMPWFAHPDRQSTDVDVVFGHWSAIGYHAEDRVHALDSGCTWGDTLSALRLDDGELFQVDSELPAVFD